ncbi:hypothetical protein BD779DRAFT_1802461 [Infundibulicybe gibba]|nr:hypothetical protein BD779DRAFT_1802461 [Infundibulicybe gibba]
MAPQETIDTIIQGSAPENLSLKPTNGNLPRSYCALHAVTPPAASPPPSSSALTLPALAHLPRPLQLLQTFHCELIESDRLEPATISLRALQACPKLEVLAWVGFRNRPFQCRLGGGRTSPSCALRHHSPPLTTSPDSLPTSLSTPHHRRTRPHIFPYPTHDILRLRAEWPPTTALLDPLTLLDFMNLQLETAHHYRHKNVHGPARLPRAAACHHPTHLPSTTPSTWSSSSSALIPASLGRYHPLHALYASASGSGWPFRINRRSACDDGGIDAWNKRV